MFKIIILTATIMSLQFCSVNKIERYSNTKYLINLEKFFNEKNLIYGSIYDFFGRLDKIFIMKSAKINNKKNDGKTIYSQSIKYIDTEKTEHITSYAMFDKKDSHSFIYKNKIMISESNCQQHGNAAHCTYDSQVKIHDGSTMVVFNDAWFYMIDENHIIGNIKIKKFGITLADIILQIEK